MEQIRVADKYKITKKLGQGAFGIALSGYNIKTNEEVAVKLEHVKSESPMLHYESKIIEQFKGEVGFAQIHYYGVEGDYNCMVMDILGPSLLDLFVFCNQTFNLKTLVWIACESIKRMEILHSKNFIHRDIKPENFLIGHGKKANILYLIDFGLSKRYKCPKSDAHIVQKEKFGVIGTARYVSLNAHMQMESSRRDDLLAVGYVLLYFARGGDLPWMDVEGDRMEELRVKQEVPLEELTQNLNDCLYLYMKYCSELEFEQKPDYQYCISLFENALIEQNIVIDYKFDWHYQKEKILEQKRIKEEEDIKKEIEKQNAKQKEKNKKGDKNIKKSINKRQEQLLAQKALLDQQEEEKKKKKEEKKRKQLQQLEEEKEKAIQNPKEIFQKEKEERKLVVKERIEKAMREEELSVIPKYKRKLMEQMENDQLFKNILEENKTPPSELQSQTIQKNSKIR